MSICAGQRQLQTNRQLGPNRNAVRGKVCRRGNAGIVRNLIEGQLSGCRRSSGGPWHAPFARAACCASHSEQQSQPSDLLSFHKRVLLPRAICLTSIVGFPAYDWQVAREMPFIPASRINDFRSVRFVGGVDFALVPNAGRCHLTRVCRTGANSLSWELQVLSS